MARVRSATLLLIEPTLVMLHNVRMDERRDFAPTDDRPASSLRERSSLARACMVGIAALCQRRTDRM